MLTEGTQTALTLGNYRKFFKLYLTTPNLGVHLIDMFHESVVMDVSTPDTAPASPPRTQTLPTSAAHQCKSRVADQVASDTVEGAFLREAEQAAGSEVKQTEQTAAQQTEQATSQKIEANGTVPGTFAQTNNQKDQSASKHRTKAVEIGGEGVSSGLAQFPQTSPPRDFFPPIDYGKVGAGVLPTEELEHTSYSSMTSPVASPTSRANMTSALPSNSMNSSTSAMATSTTPLSLLSIPCIASFPWITANSGLSGKCQFLALLHKRPSSRPAPTNPAPQDPRALGNQKMPAEDRKTRSDLRQFRAWTKHHRHSARSESQNLMTALSSISSLPTYQQILNEIR
ncbi:hypothetical protein K402DRAFT_418567 [Aulographum hederae CBS 113979]|uniref:Uncharacterized protein n=1 Tax=Aulographum hederae CBS 113979 TaxID=1176131 RepID=A0A6G1H7T4_9PEZI|nr:hypothetical protein K402DRAFT_418567 [Aulographum hederae CBS 113979]